MPNRIPNVPFSAHVEAWLDVDQERIPVGSVGPKFLTVREGCDFEAGTNALLELHVDRVPVQWAIVLVDGAVPFDNEIPYVLKGDEPRGELPDFEGGGPARLRFP